MQVMVDFTLPVAGDYYVSYFNIAYGGTVLVNALS